MKLFFTTIRPTQQFIQHCSPPSAYRNTRAVKQYRLVPAARASQFSYAIKLDHGRTVYAGKAQWIEPGLERA